MAPHIDLERARSLMRAANMDALLLCSPESFFYGTGCASMIFELYRQAPLAMALLPCEPDVPPAIIVPEMDVAAARHASGVQDVYGIPLWWQIYDQFAPPLGPPPSSPPKGGGLRGGRLPEQYDPRAICELLAELLRERGLAGGRVGLELGFVDVNTYALLQQANPDVAFVEDTALLYDLRAVKNPEEIQNLRLACALAEAGIETAALEIGAGTTIGAITDAFQRGVWQAAASSPPLVPPQWGEVPRRLREGKKGGGDLRDRLGGITGQPTITAPGMPAGSRAVGGPATTIKFDVQVCVSHYHADLGRSYVWGEPTPDQRRIYAALQAAHARMREALRPGTPISALYHAARQALDQAGLQRHSRGHFGHSVGLDVKVEEPPFISPAENRPLQPGMVLAIETPFYGWGLGVFQIEDMCLITEDGCEIWNRLPYDLVRLPPLSRPPMGRSPAPSAGGEAGGGRTEEEP